MKITIRDRRSFSINQKSRRKFTPDGNFLEVPARVARTGIQEYTAAELGLKGDPNRIVKVLRPPEEVFSPESLDSYATRDITDNHPQKMVDSETYREVNRGLVAGPGRPDGDFVVCDLVVKDADTIRAIEAGKVECSAGYSATYDDNVPEGADYEFIQRDIRINHVAIVDCARAGMQARLFDNKSKGRVMRIKLYDSEREVEIAEDSSAILIVESLDRAKKQKDELTSECLKLKDSMDTLKDELKEAKALSSDEAIKARVAVVSKTMDSAKLIAGPDFVCDSMDPVEIRINVLKKEDPEVNWADESPAYAKGAFDRLEKEAKKRKEEKDEEEEEEGEVEDKKSKDSMIHRQRIQLAKDGSSQPAKVSTMNDVYSDMKRDIANAWRK